MTEADAVCEYARRFHHVVGHQAVGGEHHVASPLGAWLVLALAAPAAVGDERTRLAEVLGGDLDRAAAFAGELLRAPHPALRLGAAAWRRPGLESPALTNWLAGIADVAQVGDLPTQPAADAWAAEMTGGLIDKFPLTIDTQTLLVLASTLACAVSWWSPFETAEVNELRLPVAPSFAGVRRFLRDPGSSRVGAIVASDVGRLGVHAAESKDGDLVVVSVVADASVPAADVLDRAHEVAVPIANDSELAAGESLFDLPVGVGHSWTITERHAPVSTRDGREEHWDSTLLPSWSAESEHDLARHPDLGFGVAAGALARLIGGYTRFEAVQVALARYTRTGFEAAAVTATGIFTSARLRERIGVVRTARLEFVRPYAVVAVARGEGTPWAGLPVFSAWVTSPDETD